MVTKAIVEEIISEYEVTVRIPTLDAGSNFSSSTQNYNLANAIICVPPQCVYSPTKGDIVIVSFEDNDFGKPIILGCLFKESGNTSGMSANLATLNVLGNTKLSTQTTIGNISYQQLQNVLTYTDDITNEINGCGRLADMNTIIWGNKTYWYENSTANQPNGETDWGTVTYQIGASDALWLVQTVYPNNRHYFYSRNCVNGNWENWKKIEGNSGLYAVYSFPDNASSFSFQIGEAGDLEKYNYEFIFVTNNCPVDKQIFLRFGNSSGDLDTGGEYSKVGQEFGTSPPYYNVTPTSYNINGTYEWMYNNSRDAELNGFLKIQAWAGQIIFASGQYGRAYGGPMQMTTLTRYVTPSNVTHARIYVDNGTFSGTGGRMYVYRRVK